MSVTMWIALAVGATVVIGLLLRRRDETTVMPAHLQAPTAAGMTPARAPSALSRDRRLPVMPLEDRDTQFLGAWSEGRHDGVRVAFQSHGKGIAIFAGDFDPDAEQLTETYLSQVGYTQSLPPDGSPSRLSVAIGNEGFALDTRFYLNATGGDYAQLRSADVREALSRLTDSIEEVMLFENAGGVELLADESATTASLASDLETAVALFNALQ